MIRIFTLLLVSSYVYGQPIINAGDMPSPGDTARISIMNSVSNFDPDDTGENHHWDFSHLTFNRQTVDTFFDVTQTAPAYNVVFNNPADPNYRASVATPGDDRSPPGGQVEISDVYNFFKTQALKYSQIGFAAKINGVPTPLKWNEPEIIYKLPVAYGDVDSSKTYYNISVPTFGYYGQWRNKEIEVDGWGQLTTPYGSFDTYRIKSVNVVQDTIYYDSYGIGMKMPARTEIEYRWLADNMPVPVLLIRKETVGHSARYFDSIPETSHSNNILANADYLHIYPNPSRGHIKVSYKLDIQAEGKDIFLTDINGRIVYSTPFTQGRNTFEIPEHIGKGQFLLHIPGHQTYKVIRL